MSRPRSTEPTPAELEVLNILWETGPKTVREAMDVLPRDRAYTSVMSLFNVMYEKGLVTREPEGRAFRYSAKSQPARTQRNMLGSLLDRAFEGSASTLVARLLEQAKPTQQELGEISKLIDEYKRRRESAP